MKNIVVLGDSFTYGQGCLDRKFPEDCFINNFNNRVLKTPSEYCWINLLQKDYKDYNFINLARPGNSLQNMFLNLYDFDKNNENINVNCVIISITSFNRSVIPSFDKNNLTNWLYNNTRQFNDEPDEAFGARLNFAKYFLTQEVVNLNGFLNLLGLISFCKEKYNNVFYTYPDFNFEQYKSFLEKFNNKNYFPHMFEYDYSNSKDKKFNESCLVGSGDLHPNEKGHQIYYDRVIKSFFAQYLQEI